jgi:Bacterial protein of unknown function (DUF839)
MRRAQFASLALVAVLAGALTTVGGASHDGGGFDTSKPPYLVPTATGVEVDPIISTGDIIGGYQMSGIPDGLGGYRKTDVRGDDNDDNHAQGRRIRVLMNHELGRSFPGTPPGVDARITRLEIDRRTRRVHAAEYLFTGHEMFERFCSATLMLIDGRPLYFTGEEAVPMPNQPPPPPHDGSSIVMDAETGFYRETPHFGHFQHENVVPLRLSDWVFLSSEDDFRPGPSYLYAYIADDFERGVRGTTGSLYVWRANDPAKNQNSAVTKGELVPGHFVPIPQSQNMNSTQLKAAATAANGFRFDRLEDIAAHPGITGRTYVADTGKPPATARGRVYQFDVNPANPTLASLKMILNGDAPDNDDIYNPDNMDASDRVLMIQEDRESAFRDPPFSGGFGRVMEYRFSNQALRSVARVNTPPPLRPGTWESSGIIDAGRLLGRDWWLLDVQAHSTTAPQPGPSLVPNSSVGEDGQFLALFVPGSQGGGGGHDDD